MGAWGGKSGLHTVERQVPRREGGQESLAKRSRRKHERVIGCKRSSDRSAQFWFHSNSNLFYLQLFNPILAKPEIGKEVGRRRARS